MINRRTIWAALSLLLVAFILAGCSSAALPMQHWPGLTVADGVVYAINGSPQQVMMYDAATGAAKGAGFTPAGQFPGTHYWSPVTVGDDGLAFVGFGDDRARENYLVAFDPTTSQEQWRVPADDLILASPVVTNGVVYFGTSSGSVYAVDTATRAVKPGWQFKAKEAIWGSPLVSGGRVYVPSMDHNLYCLDAETGQVVWTFTAGGALAARPHIEGDRLYQGSFDGRLYAVSPDSGERATGFDFSAGNWIWSEALITGGVIYVTSLDGELHALDAATGQPLAGFQTYTVPVETDYIRAAPIAAGDFVIVASGEGRVVALNATTGQVMWQWPSGATLPLSGILTNPVVADGRVYVILLNGQVNALDATTGNQVPGWPQPPAVAPN